MRESTVVNEWKSEGRQEGRVEGQRRSLLRMLRSKFGTTIPAEIVRAIEAQGDPATLDDWIGRAVLIGSVESLRKVIGIE